MLLARIGGFHEGEDLDGFLGLNRRDARQEEFHDLSHERNVTVERTGLRLSFRPTDQPVKIFVFPEDALSTMTPKPDDFDLSIGSGGPLNRFAAGAHNGIERFHTVNSIPEEVGLMRLDFTGAVGFGILNLP